MIITKNCSRCGKKFQTINTFPDRICESCFDQMLERENECLKKELKKSISSEGCWIEQQNSSHWGEE